MGDRSTTWPNEKQNDGQVQELNWSGESVFRWEDMMGYQAEPCNERVDVRPKSTQAAFNHYSPNNTPKTIDTDRYMCETTPPSSFRIPQEEIRWG
jgi:hypothetical protein